MYRTCLGWVLGLSLLFGVACAQAASVQLAWEHEGEGHRGYKIYYGTQSQASVVRPTGGGAAPYEQVVTLSDPQARTATLDLEPGIYYVRVTAFNEQLESDFSNEAMGTIGLDAPSNLRITVIVVGP